MKAHRLTDQQHRSLEVLRVVRRSRHWTLYDTEQGAPVWMYLSSPQGGAVAKNKTVLEKQDMIRAYQSGIATNVARLAEVYGLSWPAARDVINQQAAIMSIHPLVAAHTTKVLSVDTKGVAKLGAPPELTRTLRNLDSEDLCQLHAAIVSFKLPTVMEDKSKLSLAIFLSQGVTSFEAVRAVRAASDTHWTDIENRVLKVMMNFFSRERLLSTVEDHESPRVMEARVQALSGTGLDTSRVQDASSQASRKRAASSLTQQQEGQDEGWRAQAAVEGMAMGGRAANGLLLLFESVQVSRGSGLLRCQGHFDPLSSEATQVAFDYVRSHMLKIQQALPSRPSPQCNLLAADMDTVLTCAPENTQKFGPSLGAAAVLCFVSLAFGVQKRRDVAVTGCTDLRGRLIRVDAMVSEVKGAMEGEGIKLVLCPDKSAARYREEAPPEHGNKVEVRGVNCMLDMVRLAFASSEPVAAAPAAAAGGTSADDSVPTPTSRYDEDEDDCGYEAIPPFPKELEVDPGCYMGMASALTYCVSGTTPRKARGMRLDICCLAVPGSGRVSVSGKAELEYGGSCRSAIEWLGLEGCAGIRKRQMGTPRCDPTTLQTDYDVHFTFWSEPTEIKYEPQLRLAIYLAAVSMLMGWAMDPDWAVLGDVTASGELLHMTHVGDLDVDFVHQAKIGCLIVPQNIVADFIRSGRRYGNTAYYGVANMWEAIRFPFPAATGEDSDTEDVSQSSSKRQRLQTQQEEEGEESELMVIG